ncbi:glycosyltransferase family 2 protein [Priestia megaterium]|uniref:glycosyltransferase n=1 Tax=Priestia megaterium TaxID=1404 RepID=UPI00221FBB18|nr:glycosyltransferase [Priestia megaterium]UYV54090.1 glycosyltransferase [Priestia megaterium]
MNVSIVIPTYNPGKEFKVLIRNLLENLRHLQEETEIIIIDSCSSDGSLDFIENEKIKIIKIKKSEFNHGGTRNLGANIAKGEILVFVTQDALPTSNYAIKKLIEPLLKNDLIGMTYGRQLPHPNADYFGSFARKFNYPTESSIKTKSDKHKLGIKTVFVSNSFAAYKKEILMSKIGGFPKDTILSEDTYVAAKMVKNGYSIAYTGEAEVYHSHSYTIWQEFNRYFDIGTFYGRENWILKEFSAAEREGNKFVVSQFKDILKSKKIHLIPSFFLRNLMKLIGYKLGIRENLLPVYIKKKISMHKQFWD